jgi:Uncharacterized protein conserved in bacteria C-term(DUF2220)
MRRRFTDADELLDYLLDRHEAGVARPIAYPDYDSFASVTVIDAFLKALRRAEEAGAVRLSYGKNSHRDRVDHIRFESADVLYRYRGRTPIASIARDAHARVVAGLSLHTGLAAAALEMASTWASAKSWNGFTPDDANKVRDVVLLAQAILDGRHAGMDYRTFSRKVSGESKTLERLERPVVRLLTRLRDLPPDARPREALRTLGLEKFAPPLLISGHVDLADADLSRGMPLYLGVPPNEADRLRFRRVPVYLLTVENYASFNRHIIEADPAGAGVTIYVGGYPSLAMQNALRVLASKLPESVPLFHWSDVDADGTWIFRTIEKAIGRRLRPHLMSPTIAEQFGRSGNGGSNIRDCPPDSGIAALVDYLAREDAKTVEQEELDPKLPVDLTDTSTVAT